MNVIYGINDDDDDYDDYVDNDNFVDDYTKLSIDLMVVLVYIYIFISIDYEYTYTELTGIKFQNSNLIPSGYGLQYGLNSSI